MVSLQTFTIINKRSLFLNSKRQEKRKQRTCNIHLQNMYLIELSQMEYLTAYIQDEWMKKSSWRGVLEAFYSTGTYPFRSTILKHCFHLNSREKFYVLIISITQFSL